MRQGPNPKGSAVIFVGRYLPLVIIAGFFLELAVIIAVGKKIGVLAVLLLIAAGFVVGGSVIRAAGVGIAAALQSPGRELRFASRDAAAGFLLMMAGLLFIVPGFVSDLIGLALLPRPVRDWLASLIMARAAMHEQAYRREAHAGGTVIEGEAVEITGEIADHKGGKRK